MTGNVWTAAMHERFKELHRDQAKLPFEAIAIAMSKEFNIELTRNACIGKARRLGLPMRGANAHRLVRKEEVKCTRIRKFKIRAEIAAPIAPSPPLVPKGPFQMTIYDLRDGVCKWPGGNALDRPPFMYCGKTALAGLPYCKTHTAKARGRQIA